MFYFTKKILLKEQSLNGACFGHSCWDGLGPHLSCLHVFLLPSGQWCPRKQSKALGWGI